MEDNSLKPGEVVWILFPTRDVKIQGVVCDPVNPYPGGSIQVRHPWLDITTGKTEEICNAFRPIQLKKLNGLERILSEI